MNNRWTTVATLILLIASAARGADAVSPPDIVFVLVDDLRWDALSYKNHPYVKTPHIDQLRMRGASFKNAFVTTSICCPSRATYLTGVYANQHGVIDNETSEYNPDVTPPVTKYLQQAGYRTAMLGKWHMGQTARPRRYFNHWVSFKGQGKYQDPLFNINGKRVQESGYTTDILNDKAINFIKRQPKDRPYFLMLSHKAVHQPFQPAPRHAMAFGPDDQVKAPESFLIDMKNKPLWQRRQLVRDVRWDWRTRDTESESIPETIPLAPWEGDARAINQFRCVAAVDDGIGRIVETLKQRGTLDKTLIIFTSDNGYFHWEHRRWDKRLAYEESLRIPMVMALPGKIQPNSTVTKLVSNLDFAPTVLSFAGVPVPKQMQGQTMTALLDPKETQSTQPWRNELFYEYWVDLVHEIPTMIALRTDKYKLIRFPEIHDLDELYDLEADPHELNNLAVDPAYSKL
ncbi:MAG: sulfatase, partial [Planctomycetota bacterium]